ncbi:peroxiredoxin family protein [Kordia jejudonensis]|uniref:peroxiredoxin family protein n=1 Tax=Kordia jejudonensis TaxID=1348245 RepID=UPI0006298498|nr:peroxiredoxin family protein [Kordia jejudonensis]
MALIALADGMIHLFKGAFSIQHFGHFITAGSIVFFFAKIFIKPIPRTDTVLKSYTFLVFLGCISSFISGNLIGEIHLTCTILNFTLVLGWVTYLVWYSYFQHRNEEENHLLNIGNKLPLLTFENAQGAVVTSDRFAGTPSIFMFYRGNWCPFCMAQIQEMVDNHKELSDRNINTIFISSQPHNFSKKLTEKHSLDFQFLVDVEHKVSKQLHIFDENGLPFGFQIFGFSSDTTLPTVIITDAEEKIIYTNQTDHYRTRPTPSELLKVIDVNS